MIGLLLLSITLTALVVALCAVLHGQHIASLNKLRQQQEMLANLDTAIKGLVDQQNNTYKRMDQLATDVLQREIYQNADDRHQLAIESARQGKNLPELAQRHGLSSDEAALIISLHSPQTSVDDNAVKNANLIDPALEDVV